MFQQLVYLPDKCPVQCMNGMLRAFAIHTEVLARAFPRDHQGNEV